MSVYFIRCGGYIKIGYSDNPERRLTNLFQSGTRYTAPAEVQANPDDRELLHVIKGAEKCDERAIHLALDEFSVGLEWFLDEEPVRDFIAATVTYTPDSKYPTVPRPGGWCEVEYREVQRGRAEAYEKTWQARAARRAS